MILSLTAAPRVLWAGFDNLELGQSTVIRVLLLGYSNGFQVLDVENASNVSEVVSKRDGPVTFLQIQPIPTKTSSQEGFGTSHPLLLVVAGDETNNTTPALPVRDNNNAEPQLGTSALSPTAVRFYSLRFHNYVHVLRFRSAVYMVRCSPHIVAVGLATQVYCFDALTLENKFSVLTYPVPQVGVQGAAGINVGYGPLAVGSRWLAYASNNPLLSNMTRLSPQSLTPSPGVSPSTSPGNGNLMARYALESGKHIAAGIINLGDMGYKTLSKYCQELLPDGSSSPVSSSSGWKVSRLGSAAHSNDVDNAGLVLVKDFVSRVVISQFRAHTSPISALCFDPSGTLLVTASVHGNNINIFRVMPSSVQNGPGSPTNDWGSAHVHLYKLYRGITTAVIQDICFNHFSQWIAIVSSKGTCHIFVLSPFGGEASLQTQNSCSEGPTLVPGLSLPWWSTSTCMINQQSFSPPPPVTLSVVSRIKNGNAGWINTVSNAAASAAGKVFVPSGAVAASFHNSVFQSRQLVPSKAKALEHLLICTPSGYLIQHELLPSFGIESNDSGLRVASGSLMQMQDEDLRVKVEPVQWWCVCRRSDWPEREKCISSTIEATNLSMYNSDCEDSITETDFVKPNERPHWYLSKAEVQISSGRIPIWQNPKISFHVLGPLGTNERKFTKDYIGGEIEIEKAPLYEVEIKRKDLLPVFNHFHSIKSDWSDRAPVSRKYPSTSAYELNRTKDKFKEEITFRQSKLASLGSLESSDAGSSKTTDSLDLVQNKFVKTSINLNRAINEIEGETGAISSNRDGVSFLLEHSNRGDVQEKDSSAIPGLTSLKSNSVEEVEPSSGISANNSSPVGLVNSHDQLVFDHYFKGGYCKVSEFDDFHEPTEAVNDADSSSSHCDREKLEEDEENNDMLGGVFAFSEEVSRFRALFNLRVDQYRLKTMLISTTIDLEGLIKLKLINKTILL
ncbi:hypothetical protein GIB67_009887 [Kingdonia uniflora]|uniref:Uncharacterized protein n=1 Tax=Kingdonia uniflora TaxID=39325 RepID=A0A7J7L7Y3_9MAGN|nr:hypothetical protein GIB67_009887 [Kingdonia uniflora]